MSDANKEQEPPQATTDQKEVEQKKTERDTAEDEQPDSKKQKTDATPFGSFSATPFKFSDIGMFSFSQLAQKAEETKDKEAKDKESSSSPASLSGFTASPLGGFSTTSPAATTQHAAKLSTTIQVETGEENEETLCQQHIKLFMLVQDGDKSSWKERAAGILKINKDKEAGSCRLLLRAEGTLKLVLNTSLASCKIHPPTQKQHSITFATVSGTEVQSYCIKLTKQSTITSTELHENLVQAQEKGSISTTPVTTTTKSNTEANQPTTASPAQQPEGK
eukprot:TRINITY_DN93860_c0_g1_i1.p1 TRINITY_DN93860_c0_g1~~TRINITY_DN93860_c0_g1_i1.p1  ORF type:complete len:288 (+),score=36.23 TRINITY_DN93860_c0_g1_i1:35-865(+)